MNFSVRIVIMDSKASPLRMNKGLSYLGGEGGAKRMEVNYSANIPAQLSIQNATNPPWPNLNEGVRWGKGDGGVAYFRVNSSRNARFRSE